MSYRLRLPGWGFVLVATACESPYALPPTLCDDYCLSTQRAQCEEDWPDQCVFTCEYDYDESRCKSEWTNLVACFEAEPDEAFVCSSGVSTPLPGVCALERRALATCQDPLLRSCADICRWLGSCAGFDTEGCLRSCPESQARCNRETVDYFFCLLLDPSHCEDEASCSKERAAFENCVAG